MSLLIDGSEICLYEAGIPVEVEGLVINEINYRSSVGFNPGDWIELYNPKSAAIDLSNWLIKDDNNYTYFCDTRRHSNSRKWIFGYCQRCRLLSVVYFQTRPYIGEIGLWIWGD